MKVLLIADLSSSYNRTVLKGIIHYSKDHGDWSFLRTSPEAGDLASRAREWEADAAIVLGGGVDVREFCEDGLGVIAQNHPGEESGVINITGLYRETGSMAAEYFMGLGYKSFAFYGLEDTVWSHGRYEGFKEAVAGHGYHLSEFLVQKSGSDTVSSAGLRLRDWLRTLPEKTALFACDDYYALIVSDICNSNGIAIPGRLAILGVDDDDIYCNISNPPLSSIVIDAERGGYMAAQRLEEMVARVRTGELAGDERKTADITIPPIQIVERESTSISAISDRYVAAAIDFIKQNYRKKIHVGDILREIPLSRRIFERRFVEATGIPVYNYILRYRIDRLTDLLLKSDRKIEDLAIECGFTDGKNISRTFQKFKGLTPSSLRR